MPATQTAEIPSCPPGEVNVMELGALPNTPDDRQGEEGVGTAAANETTAVAPLQLTALVKLRVVGAAFCFFNAGVNDGSLGVLIPYLLRHYNHSTGWMAIPYGVSFFGWFLVAIFGGYARVTIGFGGIIIMGAALQLLAQILRFWTPPFGLFAVTFFIVALGQALQDSQANTYVSKIEKAHRWLGLIHGSYALGGLVGPLIATAIATNTNGNWAIFYYVPMGLGLVNILLCGYAFRSDTALYARVKSNGATAVQEATARTNQAFALRELSATVKEKSVWLLSLFFFVYLGAVITAGGWVVEFLLVVRHGSLARVGYIGSAFYGGTALGRLVLAEPTFRLGEKRMLLLYTVLSLALQIVFWQVRNIVVDAVMVSLMGFLLGPCFATGVSVGSKIMPAELQPSGLGALIFVVAQAGGSLLPALTGVIAAKAGAGTLQPILVGLIAAMAVVWFWVPDPRKRGVS